MTRLSGGWAGSNRKNELPADWESRIRPAIIARDSARCRWIEGGRRCAAKGTDVDHVGDKHDHGLQNLRLLCNFHHLKRSSAQGHAAKKARADRNVENHPAYG